MSKIIQRAEARQAGLVRYYTGKPCQSGHLSERSVTSGACLECRRSTSDQSTGARAFSTSEERQVKADAVEAVKAAKRAVKEAQAEILPVTLLLQPMSVPLMRDTSVALLQARYPHLSRLDCLCTFRPKPADSGFARHWFYTHPDDEQMLKDIAMALLNKATRENGAFNREARLAAALKIADDAAETTPDWAMKP